MAASGIGATVTPLFGRQGQTTRPTGIGSATASVGSRGEFFDEVARPSHVANAILPLLPEPLQLRHGPLIVTLQWWADGAVVADLPICALSGQGATDTEALENLGSIMLDWAAGLKKLGDENIGGALQRQWLAFQALVDVSRL
jgi:hypothetical protein